MIDVDALDPLPAVALGTVTVLVDRTRPVAALRGSDGSVRLVVWPDAPLPARAASPVVIGAPHCVWVVYSEVPWEASQASTAVRLDPDGGVITCELGDLAVIGADSTGVWLGPDPNLSMEVPRTGGDDDAGEGADGPPAGFEDVPVESWAEFQRAEDEARAELPDRTRWDAAGPPGAGGSASSGWFAHAPLADPVPPVTPPEPPAPVPTGPTTLQRVRADGRREPITVSRVVSRVVADRDDALRLVFHPTGPVLTPDRYGGHSVSYPRRVVEIDVTGGIPATLDLDAAPSLPLADEEEEEAAAGSPPEGGWDPVDLRGAAGTRWTPRPREPHRTAAAVEAVRAQYASLAEPRTVWTRRDDRWHRVESEYAEVRVSADGEWPSTEVIVDFTLRRLPGRPFRHRERVFDPSGAPRGVPHLTVFLEEALATTDPDRLPVREGRTVV